MLVEAIFILTMDYSSVGYYFNFAWGQLCLFIVNIQMMFIKMDGPMYV